MREACARFLPVKASRVDNYTADRRPVAAEPFRRRVDDDISTERHNGAPETCCSEGVVDLENEAGQCHLTLKLRLCIP